tara:strand:- start:9 stop:380 length:372 start_codon:yes stop_codon:yes gene_type:complete
MSFVLLEDMSGGIGTPFMLSNEDPRRSKLPVRERHGEDDDINERRSGLTGVLLMFPTRPLLALPGMGGDLSGTMLPNPFGVELFAKSLEDNNPLAKIRAFPPVFSSRMRSMLRSSSVVNGNLH